MKRSRDKQIRILSVIGIHCITFSVAYVYFKYLYTNDRLLSVAYASNYLVEIIKQSFIVNTAILLLLLIVCIVQKKKTADYLAFKIEKKITKIVVLILAVIYLVLLVYQLAVYDDKVTVFFKWFYYLIAVAFCEELEYRALMPAILKDRTHKYVEWILPNILFACAHLLLPMVQGKGIAELLGILLSSLLGYTLIGMFWEWCKRVSGSLWVGVLMHAITDFGI